MKLVTYIKEEHEQLGVLINDMIYDMEVLQALKTVPTLM